MIRVWLEVFLHITYIKPSSNTELSLIVPSKELI